MFVLGNQGELYSVSDLSGSSKTSELFSRMTAITGIPPSDCRLQIIHTDGDHWVAVSTFNTQGADTIVYDPKYSSVSKSTQTILAKLVNTDKPAFSKDGKCSEAVRLFRLWVVCLK